MNAPTLLSVTIALAVLGVGFGLVERFFGRRVGTPWLRREGTATDLAYWFCTPPVARTVTRIGVLVAAGAVIAISGSSISAVKAEVAAGRYPDPSIFGLGSALRSWPIGWQIAAGFLVADFAGYGGHRAFHRRSLWPFHAVHHSSPLSPGPFVPAAPTAAPRGLRPPPPSEKTPLRRDSPSRRK